MRFDGSTKPEAFTSKDETRTHLYNVYLDTEAKKLVATDGHRMIVTPVEDCENDHSGFVSRDALEYARKLAGGRKGTPTIGANGVLACENGATFPRPEGEFVNWKQVMPKPDKKARTIGVNAKYLASIFASLGDCGVRLTVRGELDPIEITTTGELGDTTIVIMPMRL
jgi:DNA polymerase III sliding clamp (beta) subunit (PCNA family)